MFRREKLRVSRIILSLIFIFNFILHSEITSNKSVNLVIQNGQLSQCFKILSSQTDIIFVYNNDITDTCYVTCSYKNSTIDKILDSILPQFNLKYDYIKSNQVIISRKTPDDFITIKGRVTDSKTDEPLPYTLVTTDHSGRGSLTNENGFFIIKNIAASEITLNIRRLGYFNKTVILEKDKNPVIYVEIGLEESAIKISPVIINAGDFDIFNIKKEPGKVALSPQNFTILPVLGNDDISRSLQLISGISTSNFGSSGLNIRGGIPSQNLVLFDGIVMYHMNHSFGFLNSFSPSAVKDVQVYKGGFPAKYGTRVSGVIEYTLKNGSITKPSIEAGCNQMSWQATGEFPLFGTGSLIVSGRSSFSNFILGSLYDRVFNSFRNNIALYEAEEQRPSGENDKRDVTFNDILGKLTLLSGKNDVVSISYFSGLDKSESRGDTKAHVIKFNENSNVKNSCLGVRWFRQWNDELFSTTVISHSKYKTGNVKDWDNTVLIDTVFINTLNTRNELTDKTIKSDLAWNISTSHKAEMGIMYSSLLTSYEFLMEYIPLYGTRINTSSKLNNGDLYSFYFQDTWQINNCFTATGGLRINKYSTINTINYEPRLSINYSFSNSITLKGAAGKYYQYLMQYDDFSNLLQARVSWITANNSDIKPLSADHYIIGALYEKNNLSVDIEVYYKKLYNVLESLHEWYISERFNSLPAIQNNASVKGIDFTVKKTWGNFLSWFSYSYCKTISRYYYENILKECPSSSDSPHKIDLVANYKLNCFIFSAVWHYMSGRPYTVPLLKETYPGSSVLHFEDPGEYNSCRFPGSHQLDISIIYTYSNSLFDANTGISIFNVYDKKNIWYRFLNLRNNKIVTTDVYMLGIIPTLFLELRF